MFEDTAMCDVGVDRNEEVQKKLAQFNDLTLVDAAVEQEGGVTTLFLANKETGKGLALRIKSRLSMYDDGIKPCTVLSVGEFDMEAPEEQTQYRVKCWR